MTIDLFIALAGFAFVSSATPGPNNLMLMASGANFGFRRTLPHLLGVNLGFILMLLTVGLGLMQVFRTYPLVQIVLQVVCVAYLTYLAWKIATAAPPEDVVAESSPLNFWQAAAFQWVNPKAWAMALTATTAYAPSQGTLDIVLVAVVFGAVNLPLVSSWTLLGQSIPRVLKRRSQLRVFNATMAVLLLLTLLPVLTFLQQ